jgi:hypothetical protein
MVLATVFIDFLLSCTLSCARCFTHAHVHCHTISVSDLLDTSPHNRSTSNSYCHAHCHGPDASAPLALFSTIHRYSHCHAIGVLYPLDTDSKHCLTEFTLSCTLLCGWRLRYAHLSKRHPIVRQMLLQKYLTTAYKFHLWLSARHTCIPHSASPHNT